MKIKEFIVFVSFFIPFASFAQQFSPVDFPVFHGTEELQFPFTGGFDAPIFNQMDIDLDGVPDLIVFDRKTSLISVFLLKNGTYIYAEEYAKNFPAIRDWMLIRDYNNDGIGDIFTTPKQLSSHGVTLWNGQLRNGEIVFEQLNSPYGNANVLSYLYFGIYYDLYVARTDIPAIHDIDNDGDLDILAFESGGGTINYFRNYCIEDGLPQDNFRLELEDRCWGKFRESVLDESIILSNDPNECAPGAGFRHAGSTISLLDLDADEDLDILLGDSEYSGIIKIENGNAENAFGINIEIDFPQNDKPVDIPWFLGTYLLDIDQDQDLELIVSPNMDSGSKNHQNIWMYKDTDPSEAVDFTFQKQDFLLDETIDWGSEIHPCFVDIDQDGLTDIILGLSGLTTNGTVENSKLIYYRNTGTTTDPVFTLWDDDYLALSQSGITHLAPAFGDINGDESLDLVIGTIGGKLIFFENLAANGQALEYQEGIFDYMLIDVGYNALPLIYDVNGDGMGDLIIGNYNSFTVDGKTGSLACFINVGEPGTAMFNPELSGAPNIVPYGDIALHENFFNLVSLTRPSIINSKQGTILAIGSVRGTINTYGFENELPNALEDSIYQLDLGKFSSATFKDIDHNGFLELLVGTNAGGLRFYGTDLKSISTAVIDYAIGKDLFTVYPNPAGKKYITIENIGSGSNDRTNDIKILDTFGRIIYSTKMHENIINIDLSGFEAGCYNIIFNNGSRIQSKPLIIVP